MSLKAFHIVFVTVSVLLAFGFGVWAVRDWQRAGDWVSLACGVASLLGAVVLVVYGKWFLRKLQGVSYL